jgi:hypothetical protein
MRMSISVGLVLSLGLISSPELNGQERHLQPPSNPAGVCGNESSGLPDFYYDAVLSRIKPPEWEHGLIRVMVGGEIRLGLWTDGEKFRLWTEKPDIPQKNINQFLHDLDQACQLPPDPGDAFKLLKINWESKDLSAAQFGQLHSDFTGALSKYVEKIRGRYAEMIATRMKIVSLDAEACKVSYDNSYEHIQVFATNRNGDVDPMIDWVHRVRKLAENSFHRPIWRESSD